MQVPKAQLREVIQHFHVIVKDEDIFARCSECNCPDFLYVNPKHLLAVKDAEFSSSPSLIGCHKKIKVDGGSILVPEGVTDNNVKIQLEIVDRNILLRRNLFYICKKCGKCYWDGSHYDKFLKEIQGLISADGKNVPQNSSKKYYNPVPPPHSSAGNQ